MNTESVERIVIAEPGLDLVTEKEGHQACRDADDECPGRSDESASRSNHHETRNGAGTESEHAGFAFKQPFGHRPDERGDRSRQRSGGESVGGDAIGRNRAAGIEAVPADPQHTGPNHAEHQIMRRHVLPPETKALAQDQAENQR